MKLFANIREIAKILFRQNGQEIGLDSNTSTTYTADRNVELPPGDADSILVGAASTQTLTNKTIDGDDNTVQDLPVTSIKTVLVDADKVILRDAAGVPTSAKIVNANVDAAAAIAYAKLSIADGDLSIAKTSGLQSALDGKVDENAAITGATATKITYDAKGLVTAGASLAAADIPSLIDATKIADGSVDNTEFQKVGTAGSQGLGELVTTDGVQTLITKDIDGETASDDSRITLPKDTSANLALLTRKEATIIYDTSLQKVVVDNGTSLVAIGSGSGAGEINAVLNPSAADAITGWTAGTSHTVSRVTSGSPLDPIISTAIQATASSTAAESSTSGVLYTISTMPTGLRNRKLKVEFFYSTSASQTWAVSVWKSGVRVPLSTDSSAVSNLMSGVTGARFIAYIDTDDSTGYTINFTRTAGSGSTNLLLTNLVNGPGLAPSSAVVSDFVELTPSIGDFSNATGLGISSADSFLRYRRVGNNIQIKAKYLFTGTGSSGSSFRWNYAPLGAGITLEVTKSPEFAIATRFNSGEPNYGVMKFTQTTYAEFGVDGSAASARGDEFGAGAGLIAFLSFDVMLPVSEWTGSGTVSTGQNDVEFAFNTDTTNADNSTAFGYGPQGTPFPSSVAALRKKRVRFPTPIKRGESVYILVRKDLNSPWAVLTGVDTSCSVQPLMRQGTAFYGIGVDTAYINDTDVDINFGTYSLANDGTYFNTGNAWSTATGYWCAVKCTQAAAVGFGLATSESRGLVLGSTESTSRTMTNVQALGTVTTNLQHFEAFKTASGQWKLKFSLSLLGSSVTSGNLFEFSISDVLFKNSSDFFQPVSISLGSPGPGQSQAIQAFTKPNTNEIRIYTTGNVQPSLFYWNLNGEVLLESKPSWA